MPLMHASEKTTKGGSGPVFIRFVKVAMILRDFRNLRFLKMVKRLRKILSTVVLTGIFLRIFTVQYLVNRVAIRIQNGAPPRLLGRLKSVSKDI